MKAHGTDGEVVYAIGDVHGCYDLLRALLARIAADYAERDCRQRPILVFLGDYVDRGPQSAKVLEALVWLRGRREIELHLLKGNHEQALLAFLDQPETGANWLPYGGAETIAAYGVRPPGSEEGAGAYARVRDDLLERMPAAHLRLLQQLQPMVVIGDYAFVHAGIRPGKPLARQSEDDLLWIRQGFLEAPGPHEKVIVHGHTWLDERPQLHEHRLGVDTGAYVTGVLTAIMLRDAGERVVLQVPELQAWSARSSVSS
ncbi:metallophosphoesterase family protein [Phenylobacterium sp.]|jgi:serine/threonine protein phosphatase 1|uniref:metallophosphoesterase family protein n=1 Tax=Phenylobacterium sp. TaxID=1871053 RepID=UPI002F3F147C